MSGPKNNLAEQLALHRKLAASADKNEANKREAFNKKLTFTPPCKPPLSLSFYSTKASAKSSLTKSRSGNTLHDNGYPSTPRFHLPTPDSCSAVRRKVYTELTPQSHKPSLQRVKPTHTETTSYPILNPPSSVTSSLASISPTRRGDIQASSLISTASEEMKLSPAPNPTVNVPGSSLAFCTSSIDSRRPSPSSKVRACSKVGVELELEKIHCEKVSVMDDICDSLTDIPPDDVHSLRRVLREVQQKLATRKKLILREESLKIHLESYTTGPPLTASTSFSPTNVSSPQLSPLPPPPQLASAVRPVQSSHYPEQCRTNSPTVCSKDMFDNFDGLEDDDWDFNMEEDVLMIEDANIPHNPERNPAPTPHNPERNPAPTPHNPERNPAPTPHNPERNPVPVPRNHDAMDSRANMDTFISRSPANSTSDGAFSRSPANSTGDGAFSRSPANFAGDSAFSRSPANSAGGSTISCSTKATFNPPFRPGGGDRLNGSFGGMSGRPNMFKPAANTSQPKDDASEFRGQYEHTREMYKIFNQVFGLKRFRPNQLEAVNAVVLGKDCFVLMPTGGGKSLCYQLPALMTPGVTVVVSPLRSLIQDQVQKLTSLGIPAKHLSSDLSLDEEREVYASLALREPVTKLLYVTPEKLGASNKLVSTLRGLHNRQMLSRFVIDEAHCISQWGHDFRPDYKKLSELRGKFSGVPIIALTATATPRVRADILHQLKMERRCKWFTQSFNRTNLTYLIVPKKPKKAIQDIIELITKSFQGQSGIVYCLSRRDCEIMAGELCRGNIAALCYHAGLSNDERSTVQQRWVQEDRCKVVCATIAFGMGIDKPGVRFVIHHSLPKSIEGYYQEAGRAGRDGMPAQCILFYNYSDMARLRRMVRSEKLSYEQEKVHLDNLYRMVQYCENLADCRRVQLLEYFAENFDSALCKNSSTPCDICQANVPFVTEDVTELVKVVVRNVQHVGKDKYTLNQYLDALKGSSVAKIANGELGSLPIYGAGGARSKHDLERLLHMLVSRDVLSESLTIGSHDNVVCYVKTGSKARDVLDGRITGITLKVKGTGKTAAKSNKTAAKTVSKGDVLKEKCLKELTAMRLTVTTKHKMKNPEYVVSSAALQAMSSQLPTSKVDMLNVEGYTEIKWDRFEGDKFLQITEAYAAEVAKLHAEGSRSGTTSAYFKENAENKTRPVIGKGKRKKVGGSGGGSADTPPVKRQAVGASGGGSADTPPVMRQAVLYSTDSGDEFEMPTKRKRVPLKGLLPHPNNTF